MTGFEPPPLVWETLTDLRDAAEGFPGGPIDLTVGTPNDPPPPVVAEILARSEAVRGYPPSAGTRAFRESAAEWMRRRLGVEVPEAAVAATIGSKEFVAGLPHWLRLRAPDRDTVLHPAIAYPTYAMGARLAGCRAVAVPVAPGGGLDLAAIDGADAARALCLWSNSPANPTGALDALGDAATWGRARGVPVVSDECYVELTWADRPRTILESGLESGVDGLLAVHSLSKRSNLAGLRVGFYAGDPDLVGYLSQLRKHAGFMVPGPVQAAAVAVLGDDTHVEEQRARYRHRLEEMVEVLRAVGLDVDMPGGGFYLWVAAPFDEGAALTRWFATEAGVLVTPGAAYGTSATGFVRLALVQPTDVVARAAERIVAAPRP